MAYGDESLIPLPMTTRGNVTAADWKLLGVDCADVSNGEVICQFVNPFPRCKIKRIQVLVTEAFTASCVIKVWKNAIAGAVDIGTFTMGATAVGKVVYIDIADTLLDAGDYIEWEVDVQDTTSGIIMPSVLVENVPELEANISDMTTTGGAAA